MRDTSRDKPQRCPACGSERVAEILYGFPAFSDDLERALAAGEIVLGGCLVSDDDPPWICTACGARIYRAE